MRSDLITHVNSRRSTYKDEEVPGLILAQRVLDRAFSRAVEVQEGSSNVHKPLGVFLEIKKKNPTRPRASAWLSRNIYALYMRLEFEVILSRNAEILILVIDEDHEAVPAGEERLPVLHPGGRPETVRDYVLRNLRKTDTAYSMKRYSSKAEGAFWTAIEIPLAQGDVL